MAAAKPPRVVPGIPGAKLPPPRPKQATIPESPAPPSFGSTLDSPPPPRDVAPSEPRGTPSSPLVVQGERRPQRQPEPETLDTFKDWPPRIATPPEFESPAAQAAAARELKRRGYRVERAPESLPSSYPPRPSQLAPQTVDTRDWWRTAKGIAVAVPVIVAGVTGILGGVTSVVVVPIIKAVREPHDGAKAKDIAEAKAAGERCETAVASERKSALAREQALADQTLAVDKRLDNIAKRVPEVKPDPGRAPAK